MNLEVLFEEAVRVVLAEAVEAHVFQGSVLKVPLFDDREDSYIVDPDVVVVRDGACVLVGDVKYKDLVGLPDHSDVYQLAAHAHAMGALKAVLIYPGDNPSRRRLGVTSAGLEIWWAIVRPTSLEVDLLGMVVEHV